MQLQKLTIGLEATNCYLLIDQHNNGVIIDPAAEGDRILTYLQNQGINLELILLTHCHYDHILAVETLRQQLKIPLLIHKDDAAGLIDAEVNLSACRPVPTTSLTPNQRVRDGQQITVGDLLLQVIHTPGHTPGGICIKVNNILLTGDTLAKDSVGSTDLIGGSYQQLISSITERLMRLEKKLLVYPGHGPATTLGREMELNPQVLQIKRSVDN